MKAAPPRAETPPPSYVTKENAFYANSTAPDIQDIEWKGKSTLPKEPPPRGAPFIATLHRDEWDIRAKARTAFFILTTNSSFRPKAQPK